VVQVVDAATNRPIPNASVEIYDRGIRKAINGTNLEGVAVNWIEPDKYIAVASKEGYEKTEQEIAFTKRDRTQVIFLNRKSLESELIEEEIIDSVDNRWEETEQVSDKRFQTSEPEHLGVTTNVLLEEENAQQLDEIDLGITTNDVLSEEVFEVSDDRFQISEEPAEESFDLGITTNDQLDEENRQSIIDDRSSPIEEAVEAALAKAETVEIEEEVILEPEPEFSTEKYRPNNVLLLLDVSGSMNDDGKMDKLKSSIRRLVMMLRGEDVLTMVDSLKPFGYTNGVKGMETAYASLEAQLIEGGNNQLIIATDGKFNSSKFSENEAVQMVKDNSDKGIVLSIIGFGEDKEASRLMKKLADLGEGSFLQVRDNEDPTELLAEEIKLRSLK
jgi:Mg-chelatase subunit ChlD